MPLTGGWEEVRGPVGLAGGSVVSPAGVQRRADILVDGGMVVAVGEGVIPGGCPRVVDLDGALLAPGLIDIHVHGFAGVSPLSADGEALRRMGDALAREGVTGWLAAFSAAPFEAVHRACSLLASPDGAAAGCLGILLEGTFLNPQACGGQDPSAMVSPSDPSARRWLDLPGLRAVVVAPELPGALDLIREAAGRGLIVAVGHTRAPGETLRAARAAGARLITHFINNGGAPSWAGRDPGLLGEGLLDPSWWVEVIGDGVHVHPGNLELLRRSRGEDGVCLISDARSAAGMADGRHRLGDGVQVTKHGPRLLADRGALAGGGLSLGACVSALLAAGTPAARVFRMAASNPARLLGLPGGSGQVVSGSPADLTAWSEGGERRLVMARGALLTG